MTGNNIEKEGMYVKLIKLIHDYFVGIRKNIVLLVLCIAVITGMLFAYNYKSSNVYKSSFTVIYKELVKKIYGDRLVKLDVLVQSEETAKLSQLLNIDEEAAKTIVSIKGKNILGEDLSEDLNTDKIPFIVELYFIDTLYIPQIQEGILGFLENGNDYLVDKKKLKIQETEDELQFISEQLAMMDTLKRKYNKMRTMNVGNKQQEQVDLGSIYELSYSLYKKKQELMRERTMADNLNVIDDAIVPVPSNRSYPMLLAIGVILGILLYTFIYYLIIPAYKLNK